MANAALPARRGSEARGATLIQRTGKRAPADARVAWYPGVSPKVRSLSRRGVFQMRSVGCVIRDGPIACVIYAAKSTEDRRGSIPGQLLECREAVEGAGGRLIVGEYSDEAFSAFAGSRGPGLAEAMRYSQELAGDGTVELWAQHSDRLARGDGRSARHAVEVALWALKNDENENRAPLLLIAGGSDHVVPAAVDRQASKRFERSSDAVTEYKEFPGRSHFTIGQGGWEEVADYALDWALEHATAATAV